MSTSIHKICILIVPKTNVKNVPNNSSNVDDFCSPAAYFFPWFSSYNVSFNPLAIWVFRSSNRCALELEGKKEKRERSQLCRPKLLCNTTSKETKNFLFTIPLFLWVNIQMINVMFNLILVVDVKRSKIMSFEFFHFMPEKKKKE